MNNAYVRTDARERLRQLPFQTIQNFIQLKKNLESNEEHQQGREEKTIIRVAPLFFSRRLGMNFITCCLKSTGK